MYEKNKIKSAHDLRGCLIANMLSVISNEGSDF